MNKDKKILLLKKKKKNERRIFKKKKQVNWRKGKMMNSLKRRRLTLMTRKMN